MLKNEQKIIKKRITSINAGKFAHFDELVKFIIGPKVLVIGPFFFTFKYIFRICLVIWYELFLYYLVKKESVILISLRCFNPYFIL